ncbi:hypothetical protein [Nocardia bovistercoris]|uniref:Uncharacterized protein n=1 Tax=Nocardia bovistercoris TaxID=2785916 RepID=A0A931IFB8_9NOCA|nr:hypothetical protein [Nocardia bovistercoris]MBH0778653.1 hypothetical protein [Nocardia bovistercoris]
MENRDVAVPLGAEVGPGYLMESGARLPRLRIELQHFHDVIQRIPVVAYAIEPPRQGTRDDISCPQCRIIEWFYPVDMDLLTKARLPAEPTEELSVVFILRGLARLEVDLGYIPSGQRRQ